jgi:transposase
MLTGPGPPNPNIPEWFNKDLSKCLHLSNNNFLKVNCDVNFGLEEHNNILCEKFKFNAVNPNFKDLEFISNHDANLIVEEIERLEKQKIKIIDNAKEKGKSTASIKSIETKYNKKIDNINKTTISRKIRVDFNDNQKNIVKYWSDCCEAIYNMCVDIHNDDNSYFNDGYMEVKREIFDLVFGKGIVSCPFDMASHEVEKFCSNLKSCYSNLKNGNIEHFTMKYKNTTNGQTIFVTKKAVNERTIFTNKLGVVKGIKEYFSQNPNIDPKKVNDCSLIYDKRENKYFFILCYNKCRPQKIENKKPAVALDLGESSFCAFFSNEDFGQIGIHMRKKILALQKNIKKSQSILNSKKNRRGEKLKNRNIIAKKILKLYKNIKNYVKELHNKTALFLCKNYERIMIPIFETKSMIETYFRYEKKEKTNVNNNEQIIDNITEMYKEILNIHEEYEIRDLEINKKLGEFIKNIDSDYKELAESLNIKKEKTKEEALKIIKKNKLEDIDNILNIEKLKAEEFEKIKNKKIEDPKIENNEEKNKRIEIYKKKRNVSIKKIFNYIKDKYGDEALKEYKKKMKKKNRLNERVKFVLMHLSHYKFQQHLINKSNEYGCKVIKVTEENTSKTCTKCGEMSKNYNDRIKGCLHCKYKLNRDYVGSRNIYIKNVPLLLK